MARSGISRDRVFALLSNHRRRQLLCLLVRSGETYSLRAIAREIVGRLAGTDPDEISDDAYRSVYVSLYQSHAPQLAAAGIVDYDETARTVRLAHNRQTETLLRIVGIAPNGSRPVGRRTKLVLLGAVVGATLCGLFALVDRAWIVPWAALVIGLVAFQIRRFAEAGTVPVSDCGDLAPAPDSPADVVDDSSHPSHRQEHGHTDREVGG